MVQLIYQPDGSARPDISGKSDDLFFGRSAKKYSFSDGARAIITHVSAVRESVFDIWKARTFDNLERAKNSLDSSADNFSRHIVTLDINSQLGVAEEFAEFDRDFWNTPVSLQNIQGHYRIDDNVILNIKRFNALPASTLEQLDDSGRIIRKAILLREQALLCLLTKGNININSVIAASRKGIG